MPTLISNRSELVVGGVPTEPGGGPAAPRPIGRAVALAALTLVVAYLCYLIFVPFLPALTWAVALATVSLPVHRRIRRRLGSENWAAGLTVAAVSLAIALPLGLVAYQLAAEARTTGEQLRVQSADGRWRETLAGIPYLGGWLTRADSYVSVEEQARNLVAGIGANTLGVVQGSLGAILQALIAVFVLYFCLRDRHRLLDEIRGLLPLAPADTERALNRVEGAIHATVYGTLLTGVLQGVTGGLMFWALGLPAPALWGVVMTVLSILPVLGAFLVWVPAAAFLLTEERVGAAVVLVAWGLLMAGPICNAVYASAAGGRMKMHPAPTLLSFVGGLAVFGVAGMVLGPAILAFASALVDAWREHVLRGRSDAPAMVLRA